MKKVPGNIWITPAEAAQIIAVWEKTGALADLVKKIRVKQKN